MRISVRARRPRYRIERTSTGVRVRRQGPNGHAILRAFVAGILGVFALMPPAAMYAFSDGSVLAALLALPAFTVFPWYPGLAGMAWMMGAAVGSWRWIEVDGNERTVSGRLDAHFLWGWKTYRIPADDLQGLAVETRRAADRNLLPTVTLEARYEGRKYLIATGTKTRRFRFFSEELLDRDRFFEFAMSVARAVGWHGQAVERNDHLEARVALHREVSGEGVEEVPGPRETAPAAPRRMPEVEVPPFEPDRLAGSGWEAVEWDPGRRVRLVREGLSGWKLGIACAVGTLGLNIPTAAAGVAFLTGAAEDVGLFWRLAVLAVALFVTVFFNAYMLTEGSTTREAAVDWEEGTLRLRRNREVRTFPLAEVRKFEVVGIRHDGGSDGGSDRQYECQVWVRVPGGRALVTETGSGPLRDRAYVTAAAMAEDLAKATGTEWTWKGWEPRSLLDATRRYLGRLARRLPGDLEEDLGAGLIERP